MHLVPCCSRGCVKMLSVSRISLVMLRNKQKERKEAYDAAQAPVPSSLPCPLLPICFCCYGGALEVSLTPRTKNVVITEIRGKEKKTYRKLETTNLE
jgi:hypothetical protein